MVSRSASMHTVFAMELFPLPAFPVSQQIWCAAGLLIHALISASIALRVPFMQPVLSCASYTACGTCRSFRASWCQLLLLSRKLNECSPAVIVSLRSCSCLSTLSLSSFLCLSAFSICSFSCCCFAWRTIVPTCLSTAMLASNYAEVRNSSAASKRFGAHQRLRESRI